MDEWGAQTQPLANLAVLDLEEGRLASAIGTFEQILKIIPPGKLPARRAVTLENLGAAHLLRGDSEVALGIFASALELTRSRADEHGEGRLLRRIGETYYTLGELDLAEQYLTQALPLAEKTKDNRTQESVLRNLGNVAFLRRDYPAALGFHRRALETSASVSDRAHLQVLVTKDLVALGQPAEAQAAGAEARSVAEKSGSARLLAAADAGRARGDRRGGAVGAAITENFDPAAAAFARNARQRAGALHGCRFPRAFLSLAFCQSTSDNGIAPSGGGAQAALAWSKRPIYAPSFSSPCGDAAPDGSVKRARFGSWTCCIATTGRCIRR